MKDFVKYLNAKQVNSIFISYFILYYILYFSLHTTQK